VAHHDEIGLEARDEHQQQHADLREIAYEVDERDSRRVRGRREDGPREHVEHRGAEDQPDEDFTEDRRLMDAVRERAGQFGRCDDQRQQKDDLK
jgi:hypothetical protein